MSRRSKICAAALSVAFASSFAIGDEPAAEVRTWSEPRTAFAGPTLDADWFAHRRTVVYLLPKGCDERAVRHAAAAIMQDRWAEGDWTLKHVFVTDAAGRALFAARQRIAVHEIAQGLTKEAGQDESFVPENEDLVRQNVFFLRDPAGDVWKELLGESSAGRRAAVVFLDYGGKVVHAVVSSEPDATASAGETPYAADARRLLPVRFDLGG